MEKELYAALLEEFQKISRHVRRLKHKNLEGSLREHRGNIHLMRIILRNPGIIQKELTQRMDIRASSMTEKIRSLEKKGWIERIQDEKDKRILHVFLTEEGKNHLNRMSNVDQEEVGELFSMLNPEERETLKELLHKITTELVKKEQEERTGEMPENERKDVT